MENNLSCTNDAKCDTKSHFPLKKFSLQLNTTAMKIIEKEAQKHRNRKDREKDIAVTNMEMEFQNSINSTILDAYITP